VRQLICAPLSELIGVRLLCHRQLNGHGVVVNLAVAIVLALVRAVLKTSGCGFEQM
jgi:hypothetical protein